MKDKDGYFFPSEQVEVLGLVLPVPIAEKDAIVDAGRARLYGREVVVGPQTRIRRGACEDE